MKIVDYFQSGQLQKAIELQTQKVKKDPIDLAARKFLGELLCFSGKLEQADQQFEVIATQEPKVAVQIALLRQLIRAEKSRRECFLEGRAPYFLDDENIELKEALKFLISYRNNDLESLTEALKTSLAANKRTVICNGKECSSIRDLDDLTHSFVEVLTTNGKYYWVGFDQIRHAVLHPPQTTLDLLWRRLTLDAATGISGEVYTPTTYINFQSEVDEKKLLGHETEWLDGDAGLVQGVGQKMFLIGEDVYPIMKIEELACR